MIWALLSLLSFALSWAGIWVVARRFSDRLIDVPNQRSSHTQPTPRGGGIAFVAAFLLTAALAAVLVADDSDGAPSLVVGSILVLMPLWAVGAVDDARGLSVRFRYLVQMFAAALAVFLFGSFPGFDALVGQLGAPWLSAALSVIAITALINFYNFMDGLDGLVGGSCAVQLAFFALYLHQPSWWLLVAALVAFLWWNWPPAKIFMGDSGSTVLGGAVALALLGAPDARTMWWAGAVTAPLLGDAVFTLLRRLRRRENILEAHKSHIYQRLNQAGWSHWRVASSYVALTSVIAALVVALS
ncbi:MAG: glycosyltransferase family 4 protein [Deltaproteobacteria bacterium]|nr:glycosyltransferase family 4 protein [Deltaproteobacteria bacterium]NND27319.1 glycosyltransferase family 4 protein [Myxococcales bacterium]MBT8464039.1 glycosyltransferase family 4 protein [Deltaproteobacteria bacterium]MBT8481493.1 glycosyltransferase family 4 protein [Deltaproteobacteria bacterium]NNK08416.1 glycosyltransferase family 4 protein [Myxococcales bacterium]